jgi:hypothetical protein
MSCELTSKRHVKTVYVLAQYQTAPKQCTTRLARSYSSAIAASDLPCMGRERTCHSKCALTKITLVQLLTTHTGGTVRRFSAIMALETLLTLTMDG